MRRLGFASSVHTRCRSKLILSVILKVAQTTNRGLKSISLEQVLRYKPSPVNRSTVHRYYAIWRVRNGLLNRCDVSACPFHTQPLRWLDGNLPFILDHANGNKFDNRPRNLRYLCPNCDSQQATRGGKNKGRVKELNDGGFVLVEKGERHQYILVTPGAAVATGVTAAITRG